MVRVLSIIAIVACLAPTQAETVLAAVTSAQKCQATKLKAAGRDAACLASAKAKTILGDASDPGRCTAKLTATFAKAEANGGCATSADASTLDARVATSATAVGALLNHNPAASAVDNGDGTFTDPCTGLQWERKVLNVCSGGNVICASDADCVGFGGVCLSSPHGAKEMYTWSSFCPHASFTALCPFDGTAFSDLIERINAGCFSADGVARAVRSGS